MQKQKQKSNEARVLARTSGVILLVVFSVASMGCQRLGVAVAQLLPAKKAKAAPTAPSEEAESQGGNTQDASGAAEQNMGGGLPPAEDFDDPNAGLNGDIQNYGDGEDMDLPEGDSAFDDFSGEGAMEAEELSDGPPEDFTGSLVGDYAKAGSANPGNDGVTGTPPGGTTGNPGNGNRRQTGGRRGKSNGQRNSAAELRKLKNPPPPSKPVYRLTENAILPVMTKEGQRVGFSVRYQLQKGAFSPKSQYGLVIEAAKAGRFGLPARLGEEGTLEVPAVPAFRPDSGPFKAYLIELTSRGPKTISNELKFNPKF